MHNCRYSASVALSVYSDVPVHGDSTQMFARVRCLESKAHVYWSFDLREPFVPHEDLSAEQRNLYYFAHGSDTPGVKV